MHSVCHGKWTNYRVLIGVIALNLSGGFSIFFGNLYAYIESYYLFRLDHTRTDLSPSWILSICLTVFPIGNLLADTVKVKFGLRLAVLIGVSFYCTGFLLTYFTVMNSVWATSLTFGVFGMFGLGIIEVLSFCFTSAWFPHQQGISGAVLTASSSVGAVIYNAVITSYINPRNLKPDYVRGDSAYFKQAEILDRVPTLFLLLGTITLVTQVFGILMVKNPDFEFMETEMIVPKPSEHEATRLRSLSDGCSSKGSLSSASHEILNSDKETDTKMNNNMKTNDEKNKGMFSKNKLDICDTFDKCPKDVFKSTTLYLLWFSLMALSLATLVVNNYYKLFAQVWIPDDSFLTLVGSTSAISCTLMRLLLGVFIDKFRMKTVVIGTLSITSVFLTFWYFTARLNRWVYFLTTNLLSGLTGTIFMLYPLASMKFFGLTHFATNTGLVMMAMTVVDVAAAPVVTLLRDTYGWVWLFLLVSSFIASSLVATTVLMPRSQIFGKT